MTDHKYVRVIPRKPLPESWVLVHNFLPYGRQIGMDGFRAWTQPLNENVIPCPCAWTKDRGIPHYQPLWGADELKDVAASDAAFLRQRRVASVDALRVVRAGSREENGIDGELEVHRSRSNSRKGSCQ